MNVFKFLNANNQKLIASCVPNIEQFFGDVQIIASLEDDKLCIENAGDMLRSIEDKKESKIGALSVETILDELDSTGSSAADCDEDAIGKRCDYLKVLKPVRNVFRYAKAIFQQMQTLCPQNCWASSKMTCSSLKKI